MKEEKQKIGNNDFSPTYWKLETPRDRVRLVLPRGNYIEVTMTEDGRRLDIRGHDGMLCVHPFVTNKLSISLEAIDAYMQEKEDLLDEIEELREKVKQFEEASVPTKKTTA